MRRILGWLYRFLPEATKDSLRGDSVRSQLSADRVTPIAKVREGQIVVVAGTLPGITEPLIAPVSGRRCAYWEVRTVRNLALNQSDAPKPFTCDQDSQDFFIEDDTGRAVVRMVDYIVSIHPDVERTAESNDYTPRGGLFSETRRERVLQPGSQVLVRGQCFWEPDPDPQQPTDVLYRSPTMRLRVSAPPGAQLLISTASAGDS